VARLGDRLVNNPDRAGEAASVRVALGERSYDVAIGPGLLEQAGVHMRPLLKRPVTAIVTDDNVARLHLKTLEDSLAAAGIGSTSIVLPPGEATKSYHHLAVLCDRLLASGIERRDTIIALGGGVIGDLAGFVAATYMRGVAVVQVPTTLLAMVDASVGGKTAVDTPAGKNTVGAFHPPALVVIDPSTLASLPSREVIAGLAEVIKHGVIADAAEMDAVRRIAPSLGAGRAPAQALESLIERSVRIKARVVAADEHEHGLRKVLNFGHTIGHGVEAASEFALLHGEAVAIGMVAESRLAEAAGIASPGTAADIERATAEAGLPVRIPAGVTPDRVLQLMQSDKKRRRGVLEYALPKRVGEMAGEASAWGIPVSDPATLEILRSMY
jgi:3-dehydroquinate synthase